MTANDKARTFVILADQLIPQSGKMPRFSAVATWDDALAALDFRIDLKEGFHRGLEVDALQNAEAALETLDQHDAEAFGAISTVALATYYMNPRIRELIGYPGQESVTYDAHATPSYLTDGSLAKVVARGRRYRPTP